MARSQKSRPWLNIGALDLDNYDAEAMAADLGQQRHDNLPLSGATGRVKTPPPPDPTKLALMGVKITKQVENTLSAWGNLYDPTLDEHREDGLGSGQAHRTGANFRPSPSDGYMRGRGFARGGSHQRTRSLSPLPPRGRGRGRTLDLGTRGPSRAPPQAPPRSTPSDRGLPEEPFNMRSIKPRVQQRAMDDLSLPMMPATKAEPSDPVIGHWFAGRLAINQDNLEYFGPRTPTMRSTHVPQTSASSGSKSVAPYGPPRPTARREKHIPSNVSSEMMKSIYAPKSHPPKPARPKQPRITIEEPSPETKRAGNTKSLGSSLIAQSSSPPTPESTTHNKVSSGLQAVLHPSTNSGTEPLPTNPTLPLRSEMKQDDATASSQNPAKSIQTAAEYTKKIRLLKSEKNTVGQRLKTQQAKLVKIVVEIEALSDLLKAKSADQVHIESVIASYAEDIRRLDNAIKDLSIRAENPQVKEEIVNQEFPPATQDQYPPGRRLSEISNQTSSRKPPHGKTLRRSSDTSTKMDAQLNNEPDLANETKPKTSGASVSRKSSKALPIVHPPQMPAHADRNETFQRLNANPCPSDTSDEEVPMFPFPVKLVLRPLIDRDPLTVNLASTDIPARRIKKDLKRYLNDDEQFKALESLPAFEAFIFEASRIFFKRISKTYN